MLPACAAQAQRSLLDLCALADFQSVVDSEHFFLFEEMLRWVVPSTGCDGKLGTGLTEGGCVAGSSAGA